MFCDQEKNLELRGSIGTLEISESPEQKIEEIKQYMWQRLERYSDPYLKPYDFKRWEKYVNHLISEGKSFETIVEEIRFEKMGDQKTLQEELEATKYRRHAQEMDEAFERAKEKLRKKEIEAIAKEEDESNLSLTESKLCAECRDEYKYKLCNKCGFSFCKECFEGHNCIFDSHQAKEPEEVLSVKEEDTTQSSYSVEKINDIKIPRETHRHLNNNTVNELLCSIEKIGLLNPITITKDKKLIAGFHRIHAFSRLGREEIPCRIVDIDGLKAELAEIDENLMRNEFDYIARGDQLARRKKIYEELYPETKKGISQAKGMNKSKKGDNVEPDSVPTFVENTAQISGKSKTVIKEELQISNNVIPEAKEILKEKKLPKTNALQLSRMEPEEQKVMVERIKSGEAKNVDEAMSIDYFARKEEEEKQEQVKEEPVQKEKQESISDEDFSKLEKGLNDLAVGLNQISKEMDEDKNSEEKPLPEFPEEEPEIEKEDVKEIYDPAKPYVPDTEEEAANKKRNSGLKLNSYLCDLRNIQKFYKKVYPFDFYNNARTYFSSEKDFGKVAQAGHDIQRKLKEIDKHIKEIEEVIVKL